MNGWDTYPSRILSYSIHELELTFSAGDRTLGTEGWNMKQADVKVGDVVLTKVGDFMVKVKVLDSVYSAHDSNRRVRFRVGRIDNHGNVGFALPKARTAAALRPLPVKV
jgi:hypothetical protein